MKKGIIYLDEYYSLKFPGAKIATDKFCREKIFPNKIKNLKEDFERWYIKIALAIVIIIIFSYTYFSSNRTNFIISTDKDFENNSFINKDKGCGIKGMKKD